METFMTQRLRALKNDRRSVAIYCVMMSSTDKMRGNVLNCGQKCIMASCKVDSVYTNLALVCFGEFD